MTEEIEKEKDWLKKHRKKEIFIKIILIVSLSICFSIILIVDLTPEYIIPITILVAVLILIMIISNPFLTKLESVKRKMEYLSSEIEAYKWLRTRGSDQQKELLSHIDKGLK